MTDDMARARRPRFALLILALAGGAVLVWVLSSRQEPAKEEAPAAAASPKQQVQSAQAELREKFTRAKDVEAVRASVQEGARASIDEYRATIEANPEAEEVPALLNAMGNLYREKLVDFEGAAEAYQQIVIDYPEWVGAYAVYPQLESCYEALNDHEGLRWLFTLMMDRFPPESDLHRYAAMQLKLPVPQAAPPQVWEEPQLETAPAETSPAGEETPPAPQSESSS